MKEKIIGERSINMVKKIKKVAKALKKASALHKKQSKIIEKLITHRRRSDVVRHTTQGFLNIGNIHIMTIFRVTARFWYPS